MSDFAALGVATHMGHERHGCLMHNEMKVSLSLLGKLVRTRNKVVVNPFPEGMQIVQVVKALIKKFHHGHIQELWDHCTDCVKLRLNLSENATRVTGSHKEFHDTIRMIPGITEHAIKTRSPESVAFISKLEPILELEALMAAVKRVTDLAQHESCLYLRGLIS